MRTAEDIVRTLSARRVRVSLDGNGRLKLRGPRGAISRELHEATKEHADEIKSWLATPASIRRKHELEWTDGQFSAFCVRTIGKVGLQSPTDDRQVLAAMMRPNSRN